VTTGSVIGANSQTNATRTDISNNTQNRLNGGGGNTATCNSVFLSTQNLTGAQSQFGQHEWNAWVSLEGRTDIQNATQRTEITSVALGAYFAKRVQSDLLLDGFISVARPEYQTQDTTFTSNRTSASLSLTGSYTSGAWSVTPFAKFGAYSEQQPAYTGTGALLRPMTSPTSAGA
jgi:hypothetical protein